MKAVELIERHKGYENNTYKTDTLYLDYVALEQEEIEKFIHLVVEDNTLEEDLRNEMLTGVALYSYGEDYSYTKFDSQIFDYLIEHDIDEPLELYFRAKEDVALKLIKSWEDYIEEWKKQEGFGPGTLLNLIAIPCEATKEYLLKHCAHCKRETLDDFTGFAGWYINKQGEIEKLYSDEVIALEECAPEEASAISPMRMIAENCPECEDDYAPSELYLIFDDKYKMPFCYTCPVDATFFTKEVAEGIVVLGHEDKIFDPKCSVGKSNIGLRVINEKRMPTYSAAGMTASVSINSHNQIGGRPTSVNDVYYPNCPICGDKMHFVGQYEPDGNYQFYYFFTCEKCKTHASTYDQT